jgi:toxin ParE1/3/4
MRHFLSPEASAELDRIWEYTAIKSSSLEIADRLVDTITEHFYLIAKNPRIGRQRDELRPGYRSFPVGQYLILYRVQGEGVEIMHVLHGKRDLDALFE